MSLFKFGKKKEESNSNPEPAGRDESIESLIEEKKDMIKGIEDLSQTSVKEVMIPRIDVDFISIDTPEDELMAIIAESGHSRFPVYSESIDNVLGILYVKDLLGIISRHEPIELDKLLRKAYFIPESKKIDGLLREF
ncbi:MAG TPA: magnesium/cobalt efflux protein, partial [Treponema sp.]|nr:magnesium/cobalt efflux protein [Treponema sp.]